MLGKYLWMTAAMGICLAGCQDEMPEKGKTQTTGTVEGEIIFSTTGLGAFNEENPKSRTVYGQGDEENGKWNCPVNWITGDQVRIYYPNASSPAEKYADYEVTWDDTNKNGILDNSENDAASLVKIGEPLCWGEGTEHAFYGFYPASVAENSANPAEITGEIPMLQEMKEWKQDGNGNWTGEPDMDYAFMRAVTTVNGEEVGEPVSLRFEPLTTAIQVELTASDKLDLNGNGSAYLTSINILAENKDKTERQSLCGGFTMNLETGDVTLTSENTNNYQITIDTRIDGSPMELKPNKKVTFTAFLLPGADENGDRTIKNLKIRVAGFGVGAARVKTFEGANIAKGTISKVTLSEYTPGTGANNWMEALDDNVRLSQLSLPGSVNAASYDVMGGKFEYEGEGQSCTDATQSSHVNEQFAAGVRVFEIATDENLRLTAGGIQNQGSGYDLYYQLQFLANTLGTNSSEFIIVIPCYEPTSYDFDSYGTYVYNEKPELWTQNLYDFLAGNGERSISFNNGEALLNGVPIKAFEPNMKVKDARGKILLLTRFSGSYDDLNAWLTSHGSASTILDRTAMAYGWDYDKDRWEKRAYNIIGDEYVQMSEGQLSRWYWMGKDGTKPEGNYYIHDNWKFNGGYKSTVNAPLFYIHDWQRVCNKEDDYFHEYIPAYESAKPGIVRNETHWYESKEERINNTKAFIQGILAFKGNVSNECVYINSLAGYYIIEGYHSSSAGPFPCRMIPDAGLHGDIPPFARDINKAITEYINGLSYEERGPLGITLMNYAGSKKTPFSAFYDEVYGDQLVQAIIDNNFRFLLNTSGTSEIQ